MIKKACMASFISLAVLASSINAAEPENLSADKRIQALLSQETDLLAQPFPYRINLFMDGSTDKNQAGLRISETANQLMADKSGLFFYYELFPNAMRVPHWHANADEIGTVLNGKMRVTIWEGQGETKQFTVEKNGTWIIPQAKLHALENVGKEPMKFLVAYNSPAAADRDFLTAWASLPDTILAKAVGLTEEDIQGIKKTTINRLSGFDPAATPETEDVASPLADSFVTTQSLYEGDHGSITRIDAQHNTNMKKMAFQRTIMKPGILRVPHWYTSGDVLFFVHQGNAFFTMMNDEGKVYHTLLKKGDLVSIPVGNFHSFLNIGKEELEVYEVFNDSKDIQEITLMNGVQHFKVETIVGATKLSKALVEKIAQQPAQAYMMPY